MIVPGQAHTVLPNEGRVVQLGIVQMRVLIGSEDVPARGFTLTDFKGGEGVWTVPHLHRHMEESFYVLDGIFTFNVGEERHEAARVPMYSSRAAPHTRWKPGLEAGSCLR